MFSIGLLGFIVWSFISMASPDCEVGFCNFAICWNSSTLLGTFKSKNLSSFTQSAGNRSKMTTSSSETTRKTSYFNFTEFKKFHEKLGYQSQFTDDWLTWFVGFAEGDGALLTSKQRPRFVLTQKEKQVLLDIQNTLKFGSLRSIQGRYYRFVVEDNKHILLLCLLFNGNLVQHHRVSQLSKWIEVLNARLMHSQSSLYLVRPSMLLNMTLVKPTLRNAWLSGFTDAEGCFNVVVKRRPAISTGFQIIIRFILDQRNGLEVLSTIRDQFGFGFVSLRASTNNVYRYTHKTFMGISSLLEYFDQYPLKSKKLRSFEIWHQVYIMICRKEHLNIEGVESIRRMSKTINVKIHETGQIGSIKPRGYGTVSPINKMKI